LRLIVVLIVTKSPSSSLKTFGFRLAKCHIFKFRVKRFVKIQNHINLGVKKIGYNDNMGIEEKNTYIF